eukprot:17331-Heterococcus_DN1.PRE.3
MAPAALIHRGIEHCAHRLMLLLQHAGRSQSFATWREYVWPDEVNAVYNASVVTPTHSDRQQLAMVGYAHLLNHTLSVKLRSYTSGATVSTRSISSNA